MLVLNLQMLCYIHTLYIYKDMLYRPTYLILYTPVIFQKVKIDIFVTYTYALQIRLLLTIMHSHECYIRTWCTQTCNILAQIMCYIYTCYVNTCFTYMYYL